MSTDQHNGQATHSANHSEGSRFVRTADGKAKTTAPYGGYGQQYMSGAKASHTAKPDAHRAAVAQQQSASRAAVAPLKVSTQRNSHRGKLAGAILALVVLAIAGGTAWWFWSNRPVDVVVNGRPIEVRYGSKLEDAIDEAAVSVNPGNRISVAGNLIETGAGEAFSATVNGEELDAEARAAYSISGDEEIAIGDGADTMEEFDVDYREDMPKLTYDGEWGSIAYVAQWPQAGRTEVRTGRESGETADGDVVQELKDLVIKRTFPDPDDGRKLVALTFDDGPSSYTQAYLDILAEHGAKATFFCLGAGVDSDPEMVKKIVDSGNQVCSHTYNHEELPAIDRETLVSEITTAFSALKNAADLDTTIIRPPYGEFKLQTWLDSRGTISASILWTQDTEDWKLPGVDSIVANALAYVEPGSIILMHDGGGNRDQDLEALPRIIEALKADGYTFVTINEMFAADSSIPADIASGNATLPEGAVWPEEFGFEV